MVLGQSVAPIWRSAIPPSSPCMGWVVDFRIGTVPSHGQRAPFGEIGVVLFQRHVLAAPPNMPYRTLTSVTLVVEVDPAQYGVKLVIV